MTYKQGGTAKKIEADYCICAMPLTKMRSMETNVSAPYKKVIDECVYAGAYKIAWESRRFWEQDYNIYGGLEFVNVGCSPIWFPSWGLFSDRGIVVSGYTDESRAPFGKLTLEQKIAESRKSIERLHPGHGHELEKPMYYGWGKSEWNEGSWISAYGPGQERSAFGQNRGSTARAVAKGAGQAPGMEPSKQTGQARSATEARTGTNPGYETLIQPDGRIIFAGDHCSHIVAWQEGAALSALRAVQMVSDQVKAARLGGGVGAVVG